MMDVGGFQVGNLHMYDCSDQIVVSRLYERLGRAAVSKVCHAVGRVDVAQEIVQETFLKLWRRKISFETEKAAYLWIYKTAHNGAIDYIRSAVARKESGSDLPVDLVDEGADDPGTVTINRQIVRKVIGKLSQQDASVLLYYVVDGMTQLEIADLLQVSRKTVSRILSRLSETLEISEAAPCLKGLPVHF